MKNSEPQKTFSSKSHPTLQPFKHPKGMLYFYHQLAQALQESPVVIATVTSIKGSVPREVGAKMIVVPNGQIIGTIGGGAGEAKVIKQALKVLETGEKQLVAIDLSGAPHRETQGVCGGIMQVWLERWSGTASITLVNKIMNVLESGNSGALVTPFDFAKFPYLIHPYSVTAAELEVSETVFIEPLLYPPTLLIIGAGHVALPLAKIAHLVGFQIVVQDDRAEFACVERFPQATAILAQPIGEAILHLPQTSQLYAALVTRGYAQDLAALRILLQRQVKYIGMIGSERRVRTVYQLLQNEEISLKLLHKVYAPIGLDIGALTPEEIAVSICAELIKVRRGGSGLSLSEIMGAASAKNSPLIQKCF